MPSKIYLVGGETINVAQNAPVVQDALAKEPARPGWVRLEEQIGEGEVVWVKTEHVAAVVGLSDLNGEGVPV